MGDVIRAHSSSRPKPAFTWIDVDSNVELSDTDKLAINEKLLYKNVTVRVTAINVNGNTSREIQVAVQPELLKPELPEEPGTSGNKQLIIENYDVH